MLTWLTAVTSFVCATWASDTVYLKNPGLLELTLKFCSGCNYCSLTLSVQRWLAVQLSILKDCLLPNAQCCHVICNSLQLVISLPFVVDKTVREFCAESFSSSHLCNLACSDDFVVMTLLLLLQLFTSKAVVSKDLVFVSLISSVYPRSATE